MLMTNSRAARAPYPSALCSVLNIEAARESGVWLSHWAQIARSPTPLRHLPDAAAALGVGRISVKDESFRSPLGSFKALGAPVALMRLIVRLHEGEICDPARLIRGEYASQLAALTVISATDGNHGRALAAAARDIGCQCVIVLHANVSEEREAAIAQYGARIVRIAGGYDESVEVAASMAGEHGWHVVSDTSYEGYEAIPRDVMQGYGVIAAEAVAQQKCAGGTPFTHVFLQGGVGGLAAGVASYLWEHDGEARPRFIVVEPQQADCLYQSAVQGKAARATGSVDSVMAGLACGETSPLAWRFLEPCIDHFMTIDDDDAMAAMRALASGSEHDLPMVAGESGAAGFAGLTVLMHDSELARQTGLGPDSHVLAINTEGATAPAVYRAIVGESAEDVLARSMRHAGA